MSLITLDTSDVRAIDAAVALLQRVDPTEARHLGALHEVVYDPTGCDHPRALACTAGRWSERGRVAVIVRKPAVLALDDLAERVWHEGAHWVWEPDVQDYVLRHHDDETSPDRHLRDWLYRRQHALRAKLRAALRPRPSLLAEVAKGILLGAGVAATLGGSAYVGAAIGAALSRGRRGRRSR